MVDEVVRRLNISATGTGIDQTTKSLQNLSKESSTLAQVTDTNARRALSAEAAYNKQTLAVDEGAKALANIAKATKTADDALAQGIITSEEYATRIGQINEKYAETEDATERATDGTKAFGLETAVSARHLEVAALAAYRFSPAFRAIANPLILLFFRLLGPAAAAAFGLAYAALQPVIAALARILLPLTVLYAAFKAMVALFDLGGEQIAKYAKLSEDAFNSGVSASYFERTSKGAKTLGVDVDQATAALKKFNEVSAGQLGGSSIENRIEELKKAGNFKGNSGVGQFASADGTEAKYRAIVVLINEAMQKGERLAAIDLAQKFLPPELVERLRSNGEILTEMQKASDTLKPVDLVTAENLARAVSLKAQLDAASESFTTRWEPVQKMFTRWGLDFQETWVQIINLIGSAIEKVTQFFGWLTALTSKAKEQVEPTVADPMADARARLGQGLSNPASVRGAMRATIDTQARVRGDTSLAPTKEINEARDAIDRAEESLLKYIKTTEAASQAVGKSAGEMERLKATAQLQAAAEKEGIALTDERAKGFAALAERAGLAADALARARVANEIAFNRKTAFFSSEDQQIARSLVSIYGDDIPRALASSEAEAMRFNNTLKQINDIGGQFASSFISDIANGVAPMEAFSKAAKSAAQSIIDMATKKITSNLLGGLLGDTSGAAASAGILNTAGTTLAAAMVSGATTAAGILGIAVPTAAAALPVAGAVTGTEVAIGGAVAGAALTTGGTAAAFALYGPIALLIAAIAAVGFLSAGDDDEAERDERNRRREESVALSARSRAIGRDTGTRQGALDNLWDAHTAENAALKDNTNLRQQLEVQRREREQLNKDWDKKELERIEQHRQDVLDRQESYQDRLFAMTNDATTLQGALADFDRKANRERFDELRAGGEAINDLEAALSAERLDVIEQFNEEARKAGEQLIRFIQGISKDIQDYLAGLRAGSNSILNPEERLGSAQSAFDSQLAAALTGDRDALSSITQYASTLLEQANSYFAGNEGYASVYAAVTDGLEQVQGITPAVIVDNDNLIAAINATTTAVVASDPSSELTASNTLLGGLNVFSDRVVNAINGLGDITAQIGTDTSHVLRVLHDDLVVIAGAGASAGGGSVWSWLGFQSGGHIPGYAGGGMVANGSYNQDSVVARYGDGAAIGLAGKEFVTRAPSVNAATTPMLNYINKTGRLPGNDNSEVVRVLADGFNNQTTELVAAIDALGARTKRVEDAIKETSIPSRVRKAA